MSKVWRRLQRAGKKACKFKFTTFSHNLSITCTSKWQPDKVCLTWTHRERKHSSKFGQWEPGLKSVYEGLVAWDQAYDLIEFDATLYKSLNENSYEEKEWILLVENEDAQGKRKLLATGKLNINEYASIEPMFQKEINDFKLKSVSTKIKSMSMSFSIACQFLKEGKATDEDMISVASFMSSTSQLNNPYLNSNFMFNNNRSNSNLALNYISSKYDDLSDNDQTLTSKRSMKLNFDSDVENESNKLDEDDFDFYFKDKNLTFNSISHQFKESIDLSKVAQKTKPTNNDTFQLSLTTNSEESFSNKTLSPKSSNDQNSQTNTLRASNKENQTSSNSRTLPSNGISQTTKDVQQHKPVIKSQTIKVDEKSQNGKKSKTKSPIVPNESLSTRKKEESSNQVEQKNSTNPFEVLENEIINEENNVIDAKEKKLLNPFLNTPSEENKDLDENVNNPFADNDDENEPKAKSANQISSSNQIADNVACSNSMSSSSTSRDLLEWCQDIVRKAKSTNKIFQDIRIENFTSSWMNGLAFCAIISHFRPNSIDFNLLNENNAKQNLKEAFKASDSESVVRVVDTSDIINKNKLDQLLIMTYLHQLRAHFESNNNNYLKTPTKSNSIQQTGSSDSLPSKMTSSNKQQQRDITSKTNTISSPTSLLTNLTKTPVKTMNKNYSNPFDDSDDDQNSSTNPFSDQQNTVTKANGIIQINSNGEIVDENEATIKADKQKVTKRDLVKQTPVTSSNRNKKQNGDLAKSQNANTSPSLKNINSSEDLIQRARQQMEKNKQTIEPQNDEAQRKEEMKQRAKQLIAETRKNSLNQKLSPKKESLSEPSTQTSPTKKVDPNPFESSDENENELGTEYIRQEIESLSNRQRELDERGSRIEKDLRNLMRNNKSADSQQHSQQVSPKLKKLEDKLLKEWFLLVNEKNALLHQQQELEILQNEKSLERRYELLSNQLRVLMSIDDFNKTDEQRKAEQILFNELITLVNKRNELVIQMDEENKLLNEEEIINEIIQNKHSFNDEKQKSCLIQ